MNIDKLLRLIKESDYVVLEKTSDILSHSVNRKKELVLKCDHTSITITEGTVIKYKHDAIELSCEDNGEKIGITFVRKVPIERLLHPPIDICKLCNPNEIVEPVGFHAEPELEMLSWNTGRHYTMNGQRIAACEFDGGVYMVDIDRGLDYWFPDIELTHQSVMYAYDNSKQAHNDKYNELRDLRRKLEEYAEGAPKVS